MDNPLAELQAALAGRYRLEHSVGQGGMGVVYLAHDLKHARAVAIKVLRPGVASLLGPERFLREIGIAAQLNHPHIVPLHDSGDADGHLYYVMPFISGETLRERLEREGRLPADHALAIIRQVAMALSHAHGRGVIHRDIKPSNILLSEGFALVADFGLARALSRMGEAEDISSVGLPIGTPRYMSPEQAIGAPDVDGRSDLYSLGKVLQEMISEPVPPEVSLAIDRCLARNPEDRYASAEAFLAGLGGARPAPAARRWTRPALTAAILLGVAAIGLKVFSPVSPRSPGPQLDTTRIAVLPFDRLPGAPDFRADLPVRTALGGWTGITVVPGVQISEALKSSPPGALDRATANRIARQAGAGRYVRGQIVPFGDSVQVEAVLYDARDGNQLVEKSVRVSRSLSGAESIMTGLVDSLLFRGAIPVDDFDAPAGTRSVPAMWEFIAGRNAVARWDLRAADSGFARAVARDPGFVRASLWHAQVRYWQGLPPVTWRAAAAQAEAGVPKLGRRDAAMAPLLGEVARGEYGTACPRWLALTEQWPREFPVWYGAAVCLGQDRGVRRDPRSPTGWNFRSSYHQAQLSWRQAFTLLPAIYRDSRAGGLRGPQWLPWTISNRSRGGMAVPPDTGFFMSQPTWVGDTLAFVPQRLEAFTSGRVVHSKATTEAVTRQRLAFFDLATEWANAEPTSLEAREAVALALWSLGNHEAIDSIRAARKSARAPADRIRLGGTEVLMRVLRGAPDSSALRAAALLADSLLIEGADVTDIEPWDLATLAALSGRAGVAARLIREASPRSAWRLPPSLSRDALAFLVFAALGGPPDSLRALEARVAEGIASGVESARRPIERAEWLGRPVALSLLDAPLTSLPQLAGAGDYLLDAAAAFQKADHPSVRRLLERAAAGRRGMPASDLMFEAILPEARLYNAIGDRAAAARLLDPTLADLRHVSLPFVSDPVGAGLLVRAMAFRADLAALTGDSVTAGRWAAAVRTLWSNADGFLAPTLRRMSRWTATPNIH